MTPPLLDLLVVGAGPIGLATAAAALHHGAQRVLVVDQARALRPVGSNIDLLPNAYRLLCALVPGAAERLQPFVRTPTPGKPRMSTVSPDGHALYTTETRQYGTTASLYWWQLQKLILDSLPREDVLVLNHQLVNILHDDTEGVAVAEFVADIQRENRYMNWEGDDTDQPNAGVPVTSHTLSSYFEDADGIASNDLSEYGSEIKRIRCRAKIIVGADGINSDTRKCIYRDTFPGWEQFASALYSGFVKVVAAGCPRLPAAEEEALSKLYLKNGPFSMLTCSKDSIAFDSLRIMLVHAQKTSKFPFRRYIGFSVVMDESTFNTASQKELSQIALHKAHEAGFSEALTRLSSDIWESNDDGIIPNRAYYIVPATHPPPYEVVGAGAGVNYPPDFYRPWYFGRVVLAGDSAHACPPFLAQGTAMGFEDVFELVTRLTEKGVWSHEHNSVTKGMLGDVFEQYRNARLDRVCFVQRRVINRVSEYDLEKTIETREKLWTYDPSGRKF